jgi:hypothetical protein
LAALVDRIEPLFHVFGHYDDPPEPTTVGSTRVVCLNQDHAVKLPGRDGAMAVWDTEQGSLSFVDPSEV